MVSEQEFYKWCDNETQTNVLILVVVEDGLGELNFISGYSFTPEVLILVVVEDGLGEYKGGFKWVSTADCLNPCCSGRWSRSYRYDCLRCSPISLNPCCSGRWSRRL